MTLTILVEAFEGTRMQYDTCCEVTAVDCNGSRDCDCKSSHSPFLSSSTNVSPRTKPAHETRNRPAEKNAFRRCAQKLTREQSLSHSPHSDRVGGAVQHHSSASRSLHHKKLLSKPSSATVYGDDSYISEKSPVLRSLPSFRSPEEGRTSSPACVERSVLRTTSNSVFCYKSTLIEDAIISSTMRKSFEGMKAACFARKKNPPAQLQKKPLGTSLSWDPERQSRSPSSGSRSRSHSVCSEHSEQSDIDQQNRLALESSCLHCSITARNRRKQFRGAIESTAQRLRRNLGEYKPTNWSRSTEEQQQKDAPDTPDIVVSSVSSEEDVGGSLRNTASEVDSVPTSAASTPSTSACTSPQIQSQEQYFYLDASSVELGNAENDVFEQAPNISPASAGISSSLKCSSRGLLLRPQTGATTPTRSNSFDFSALRRDVEWFSVSSEDSSEEDSEQPTPAESVRTVRSRSHDPTAFPESPVVKRTAAMQVQDARAVCKHRTSRYWLDEQLSPSEHIWLPPSGPGSAANSSQDTECYIGEKDCEKTGEKRRCAACHIVAHRACFPLLCKMNLNCKITFRDMMCKKQSEAEINDALSRHHWVHRWKHEGRCAHCGKSFQHRMFREKEVIAITCSWCKQSYHNKLGCFSASCLEEKCDRGALRNMIVPPSWIVRPPALRKRTHKEPNRKPNRRKYRPFIVRPLDSSLPGPSQPLLVFVNPKSGGNKGSKALHTFCWLLNPRQVFDITSMKGPKYGLEMFRKVVKQLRMLVCGGDGTVGWVLATLDELNWPVYPPMALLPLGTGNDLSRCMGWGGSFTDEPLSHLLSAVLYETSITHLDRWQIDVQPCLSNQVETGEELSETVHSSLPLTVMNNYFSIGADAHVALQFHHSRSANPQMLNSRFKNRIAYGGLGTIDLFKRTWKDLSDYMTLECDGRDYTPTIKEFKFHCILFQNITYYAGGTIPWGSDDDENTRPSSCDGKIEVLGFTTATLAALQMGGRGERIAQCSHVNISTSKAIPMQVDGEPCLLAPSVIAIKFHSKVPMLRREKKVLNTPSAARRAIKPMKSLTNIQVASASLIIQMPVIVVGRHDYDTYRDAFERLKDTAFEIGVINVEAETELDSARQQIQKLLREHPHLPYEPSEDWKFLDYVTNAEEGTFRISTNQEHLHSVSDICNLDECLMVLDERFPSLSSRSSAIVSDLVFSPNIASSTRRMPSIRRISETLRIVFSSETQETLL
uniref:Diacylglycerol kinase n=1 Tax=Ascaris lumbricoides TaxID=6252 RepID=A0A9J2PLJ3_ASCLU